MDARRAAPTTGPRTKAESRTIRRRIEREYIVYKPATTADLGRQLREADDNTDVVIDLSALDGFDEGAARLVADHQPRLEEKSSTLALANVPSEARAVLSAASLTTLIRRRR